MQTTQDTSLDGLNDQLPSLTSSFSGWIAPLLWLSTILSIVLVILYIASLLRKRKIENAILAMQKDIHEMNEREQNREAVKPPVTKIGSNQAVPPESPTGQS